jgi:hypothetical protein
MNSERIDSTMSNKVPELLPASGNEADAVRVELMSIGCLLQSALLKDTSSNDDTRKIQARRRRVSCPYGSSAGLADLHSAKSVRYDCPTFPDVASTAAHCTTNMETLGIMYSEVNRTSCLVDRLTLSTCQLCLQTASSTSSCWAKGRMPKSGKPSTRQVLPSPSSQHL